MKRALLVTLLIVSMLSMVGFTSVEASYWENAKEMYEWDAVEEVSEMEINLSMPDGSHEYKVNMNGKSDLKTLNSYLEIKVEDLKGLQDIPTIKMYTSDLDVYINKEAVVSLLSAMGLEGSIDIQEEYIVIENDQNDMGSNPNMLKDTIGFIDKMDLGIKLDMVQEGNTYTLTLGSDEVIDLLDAYIVYVINNINDLPNSEDVTVTEAEKQEVLKAYNTFVKEYKDMAKIFTSGSEFYQESTFGDNELKQKAKWDIKTSMGELVMNSESVSTRLASYDVELPTSVMRITVEELAEIIMNRELIALVELDGSYVKFSEGNKEEGKIPLKVEEGKAYITSAEAYELLGIELDNVEGYLHVRDLENYGFGVKWNEELRTIEIYQ